MSTTNEKCTSSSLKFDHFQNFYSQGVPGLNLAATIAAHDAPEVVLNFQTRKSRTSNARNPNIPPRQQNWHNTSVIEVSPQPQLDISGGVQHPTPLSCLGKEGEIIDCSSCGRRAVTRTKSSRVIEATT
ncbi:uncharacterized protein PAC_11248 [Phialocephala subalpina]|uniref:Uncharacterized protein n=1 Tax=Phialocephala subalpina TaxID=576137 RepID=A0A1L7X8L5_9HELO|nr:uncharacterized protein PAC_11248 [Phialocephala subalpina]